MSRNDRVNKQILALERKLARGDVYSGFELFKVYEYGVSEREESGEFVEVVSIDIEKASFYLNICNDLMFNNNYGSYYGPYFSSMILTDFRKFSFLKVKFDKRITVFIGDNGAGKTTVIDAVVKTLSWLAANIVRKGGRGKPINEYDVNNNSKRYAEIKSKINLNDRTLYESELRKNSKYSQENKFSKIEPLEDLGELYRLLASKRNFGLNDKFPLPIFLYYSVGRNALKANRTYDEGNIELTLDRFYAYEKKTLDGDADFNGFLEWFITLDNLSGDGFREKLDDKKTVIDSLKLAGADAKGHTLNELYSLELSKYNELAEVVKNKETYYKRIELIKSVISTSMPGFEDIYVDKTSGRAEVMIQVEENKINITQASQGQQVLISLVSDIARKLITLNPNIKDPLNAPGIVVIDEIELHLHPKWQQSIINSLLMNFKGIQFIITTHSPQVLSTIDKKNIRMFVNGDDGRILSVSPNFQTKGVKSADIMAKIMGADSIPDVQEARDVDNFSVLLANDEIDKANRSLDDLIKHFGKNHPVVLDCENLIKIHDLKKKINKQG